MMPTLAHCKDAGDRLVVVNANPAKRNVLSPGYYRVLHEALELAGTEPRIGCVILHGEGGFFCAGGDLGLLASRRDLPRAERLRKIDDLHDVIRAVIDCPKPVISAIGGGAAGAGVSLAFACDFIVAESMAKFTVAYVKAGLVPDGGLTSTLCAQLPRAVAMRMALLGEPVSAARLHELGAITEVVPAGEALQRAHALGDRIVRGPGATQAVIKGLINTAVETTLAGQLDKERDAMADAIASPEAGEGISAFLAKRAPDFRRLRGQA